MHLRPYQLDLVSAVSASFASGHSAPLVVLPTGGGKTATAVDMVRQAIANGKRVCWLAHRAELCKQTAQAARAAGITTGLVGASLGKRVNLALAPFQVCMVQTLMKRGAPDADLCIVDEAHNFVADEFQAIAQKYQYRIGLTATPCRADGRALGEVFDDIVLGPSIADLTEMGFLCPSEVITVSRPLGPGEIAQSPLNAYLAHGRGEKAIVFASYVKTALEYAAEFNAAGIKAVTVTGEMSHDKRMKALRDHRAGYAKVLCSVGVLNEGYDDPSVSVCILARGFNHSRLYIQSVGRVLRPFPGKLTATVIDLRGSVHVHGAPDAERTYSLDGEGISRPKGVVFRKCPTCSSPLAMDDTECSACGWVSTPVESPTVVDAKLEKFAAKRKEDDGQRAKSLARWFFEARTKGYKVGWAFAKYTAVYGAGPSADVIREAKK